MGGRAIPVRYRVEGPCVVKGAATQPLCLMVITGVERQGRHRQRGPAFWLVNAVQAGEAWLLPLPAADLLAWAWQRWEVEGCHRDLKRGVGLGKLPCWDPLSAVLSGRWTAWVEAVAVLAGVRTWGLTAGPVRSLRR